MKIQLNSIHAVNFRGFECLEYSLQVGAPTLLLGENLDAGGDQFSNGSGKSSALDPLAYALYGCTTSGLRKDDVIRLGAEEAQVEVRLLVDGAEILVQRSKKRESSEKLQVLRDGEVVSPAGLNQSQSFLSELIGYSFDDFRSLLCVHSDSFSRFGQATDKERKTFLDRLIPRIFSELCEKVSGKLSEAKQCAGEMRLAVSTKQARRESLEQMLTERQRTLEVEKTKAVELRAAADTLKTQLGDESQLLEAGELFHTYTALRTAHEAECREVQREVQGCEGDRETLGRLLNELKEVQSKPQDVCPTCRRPWEQAAAHLAQEAEKRREDLRERRDAYNAKQVEVQDKQRLLEDKKAYLELLVEPSLKILIQRREASQSNKKQQEEYAGILNRLAQAEGSCRTLEDEIQRLPEQIAALQQEVDAAQGHLETTVKHQTLWEYWRQAFSLRGIPAMLMESLLDELTEYANFALEKLSAEPLSLQLTAYAERKSGDVANEISLFFSTSLGEKLYGMLSAGERRRVDLSLLLGLRALFLNHLGMDADFLFMDEVFDCLDSPGCVQTIDALTEFLPDVKLVVVTHKNDLRAYFQRMMMVQKSGGICKLQELN